MENSKFLFKLGVPSRSEQGKIRIVEVYDNGKMLCDCPARESIFCHHQQVIYEKFKNLIELIEKEALEIVDKNQATPTAQT